MRYRLVGQLTQLQRRQTQVRTEPQPSDRIRDDAVHVDLLHSVSPSSRAVCHVGLYPLHSNNQEPVRFLSFRRPPGRPVNWTSTERAWSGRSLHIHSNSLETTRNGCSDSQAIRGGRMIRRCRLPPSNIPLCLGTSPHMLD